MLHDCVTSIASNRRVRVPFLFYLALHKKPLPPGNHHASHLKSPISRW